MKHGSCKVQGASLMVPDLTTWCWSILISMLNQVISCSVCLQSLQTMQSLLDRVQPAVSAGNKGGLSSSNELWQTDTREKRVEILWADMIQNLMKHEMHWLSLHMHGPVQLKYDARIRLGWILELFMNYFCKKRKSLLVNLLSSVLVCAQKSILCWLSGGEGPLLSHE